MKHVQTFESFIDTRSISELSDRDEKPMIQGIAEILNRVKDPVNKREMVEASIADFKRDGIVFDYDQFRKLCNL